jgi:hypothetical protein
MGDIKAIETYYNGYRFRSRLEARWAVFFDALRVRYEYEPEGFYLPSGASYLPDFRVKCHGLRGSYDDSPFNLYIEVKGEMTAKDAEKIREFAGEHIVDDISSIKNPILIVGNIPDHGSEADSRILNAYDRMNGTNVYPFNYMLIDGDYFAAYPAAHNGMFYLWGDDESYIDRDDFDNVRHAYDLARQARFEHGETPKI